MNITSVITIAVCDTHQDIFILQRNGMSTTDIKEINLLYGCQTGYYYYPYLHIVWGP